ncbi:homeobox domain-containing protein [Aspergillus stella-maris]|uniref:homeobox domain-containing protein n=1 Tax=Aspergillus stella-maris TaxID=1810926 RepID=UPI003CCD1808
MSDPEPSAVILSSSPPSTQTSDSTTASSSYAFLVHSQKTLTQNLPPRVDNKLLARQKRRRTSPEDHAVLEAEYQRNPKPDKTARTNIVSRVSLGEKEVQIWFQNRRQNDRRKSKPLLPHEVIPSSQSDEPKSDDIPHSDSGLTSEEHGKDDGLHEQPPIGLPEGDSFASDALDNEQDQLGESSQTSIATSELPESSQPNVDNNLVEVEAAQNLDEASVNEPPQSSVKRKRSGSDSAGAMATTEAVTPGGITMFKSPPSLRLSMSFDGEAVLRREDELTPSPPKGRRDSLRISMSADGQAVVRGAGEPSPSKNRISMFSARKPRLAGLRRSTSAVALGTPPSSLQKERSFGRSRDPRNWESFFDTDARSALFTPFSSQSTPNAMRSSGQRSLTRSLSARHPALLTPNTPSSEHQGTPITQAMREKRRKLSRTVSSLGRLESGRKVLGEKTPSNLKKSFKDDEIEDGDSDKENWIPGTRIAQSRRRTVSHQQRPILKDSNGRSSGPQSKAQPCARSRMSQPFVRKQNGSKSMSGLGTDVSAFMGGENTASQEEDLDCIQGLLSLSQGAWR